MKNISFAFFFFCFTISSIAQKEANIWYFGIYAGLDFNSGTPIALTGGQLQTEEGCATISDKDGSLLFYTDGTTIWNKMHNVMYNGKDLKGNSTSTNSAIIVPNPENLNIYYVFTVDGQYGPNGLQYSEINMSLDNGLGGVTSNKNIMLITPISEKITAVKNSISNEYWVVSHAWDNDAFLSFKVNGLGVTSAPVVSNSGSSGSNKNWGGYQGAIKISPNGKKLAVATRGIGVELFDFNTTSGLVSNAQMLDNNTAHYLPYGVEFSSNSNILYLSDQNDGVFQFDLTSGNTAGIINSRINLAVLESNNHNEQFGALQLAVDGKIYVARKDRMYLDVINKPNISGLNCNYELAYVFLGNKYSASGLPQFIQSFFKIDTITFENACFGDLTKFTIADIVDTVVWNFGDPISGVNNISTDFNPTHFFSSPGVYEVTLSATVGSSTATETITVNISAAPLITPTVILKQCDDDLDGISAFNLNEVIPEITTNSANETITFFESKIDAENNKSPITNPTVYINQTVSTDTVWARVENSNGCFRISQVNLIVSTTQIPKSYSRNFYMCDDNVDGISKFDLSSVHTEIEAMFPAGQKLIINFYRNAADALAEENPIIDLSNYRNIGYPNMQNIFTRVDSQLDNDCLGLGAYINLFVEPIPIANPVTIGRQCDDDEDGKFLFDVSLVESTILGGQSLSNVTIAYFDEHNNSLLSPLPNPFLAATQVVTARVTNKKISDGSCYNETSLKFIVDKQPIANPVANQISCDDGADDTDGIHNFDTSLIEGAVLNGQVGMIVHYYNGSGLQLTSPLPNPFIYGTQNIKVEVINPINNNCTAQTQIKFIVNPLPQFTIETPQIVCSSDPTFTVVLNPIETNPSEIFDYKWVYQDGTILSSNPTLTVSIPGTYSITLTKTDGTFCSRTRNIFVNASELATITKNDITIIDLSNINTLTISTTNLGQGDYEFSIDSEFSNYQDYPVFENISSGIHILFIRDKKGCGTSSIALSVIGYPKFFTPNGDGINDYWQVEGVNNQFQTNSKIFIYDRYGKLLKQLSTTSSGWDGTFNGKILPSDDYWFSVLLEDEREFKGHFTLKR